MKMNSEIRWSKNPADFKEWDFDALDVGPLHDGLCAILEERMKVIFGENGIKPAIYSSFDKRGNPMLELLIGPEGSDAFVEINLPLKKILSEFIADACGYSDEAPVALKRVLEKALSELNKSIALSSSPITHHPSRG